MKAKSPQDDHVLALAEPVAETLGMEIVRVRVTSGKKTVMQIMAERADGSMEADDCAALSRALAATFEDADPVGGAYDLEVSSPGVDRPLTQPAHFARWAGFDAKLELDRLVEGRKRFRGVLAGLQDDSVAIDLDGEAETALIPFDWIADAKLVLTNALLDASLKARKQVDRESGEKKKDA
jgi:ribosome maturation factor RimP